MDRRLDHGGRAMGPNQSIDYGRLVERALRGVVRDALALVAEHGLPGRHHLYITFRTDHPGVELADELRARYPGEMTIVLQHEFWGLEVDDEGLAVTLSFNTVPQRIRIPFAAISVFADPGVEFGLQFTSADAASKEGAPAAEPEERPGASVAELPKPSGKPADGGGGEVVTLDRFRKK